MSSLMTFLSRLIGLFAILVAQSLVMHKQATVQTLAALLHNPPLLFEALVVQTCRREFAPRSTMRADKPIAALSNTMKPSPITTRPSA
jgi:hypothetical protein